MAQCCRYSDPAHVLEEMGSSAAVQCRECGETLAVVDAGADGVRRWADVDGYGQTWTRAARPAPSHTCGLSDLPCQACYRARYGGGQWLTRLRRDLDRMGRGLAVPRWWGR